MLLHDPGNRLRAEVTFDFRVHPTVAASLQGAPLNLCSNRDGPADQSRVRDVDCDGNLDPVANILRGHPDSIRAKLECCYQQADNPFIVKAGCEIPAGTPLENVLR